VSQPFRVGLPQPGKLAPSISAGALERLGAGSECSLLQYEITLSRAARQVLKVQKGEASSFRFPDP
jgi:hypothetical protein